MDAALYLRASHPKTIRGRNPKNGEGEFRLHPEIQEERLRAYCEKKGWTITAIYNDRATILRRDRPEFKHLMEEAQNKKFGVLAVASFDRFALSVGQFLVGLGKLSGLGVQFVSLHESVDTTTPQGKLLLSLVAAMAGMESALQSERVATGMVYAREHGTKTGKLIGRPRMPVDLDRVKEMAAAGTKRGEIAKSMGISISYVNAILRGIPRKKHTKPPNSTERSV
jgi:DNA invertase Pin-like site-specific DNA recombinase